MPSEILKKKHFDSILLLLKVLPRENIEKLLNHSLSLQEIPYLHTMMRLYRAFEVARMSHFNFLINIYVVEKTQYSYDSADFKVELHFFKSAYKSV